MILLKDVQGYHVGDADFPRAPFMLPYRDALDRSRETGEPVQAYGADSTWDAKAKTWFRTPEAVTS